MNEARAKAQQCIDWPLLCPPQKNRITNAENRSEIAVTYTAGFTTVIYADYHIKTWLVATNAEYIYDLGKPERAG